MELDEIYERISVNDLCIECVNESIVELKKDGLWEHIPQSLEELRHLQKEQNELLRLLVIANFKRSK